MIDAEKTKGVIFDIDGVLLDSMKVWEELPKRYVMLKGITPGQELDSIVHDMTLAEGCEYIRDAYLKEMSVSGIITEVSDMIADYYYNEAGLKDGAKDFVTSLYVKNIPMVLVTTCDRKLATAALKRNDIYQLFDGLICCDDYGKGKDDISVFLLAEDIICEKAGDRDMDNHSSIVVIEDSLMPIGTVKDHGFVTIGVRDRQQPDEWEQITALSDFAVESLNDIIIDDNKLLCPCCRKHQFTKSGAYEICPICRWEDDKLQRREPLFAGGANEESLFMYTEKWRSISGR